MNNTRASSSARRSGLAPKNKMAQRLAIPKFWHAHPAATVEWSVGLLDDAEQRFLAALSVFADGWTLAAATYVCELTEDRVLDLLDALAGHSLVNVEVSHTGSRFRMLTSVQNLAAERLAASTYRPNAEQRHAMYFGSL